MLKSMQTAQTQTGYVLYLACGTPDGTGQTLWANWWDNTKSAYSGWERMAMPLEDVPVEASPAVSDYEVFTIEKYEDCKTILRNLLKRIKENKKKIKFNFCDDISLKQAHEFLRERFTNEKVLNGYKIVSLSTLFEYGVASILIEFMRVEEKEEKRKKPDFVLAIEEETKRQSRLCEIELLKARLVELGCDFRKLDNI